MVVHGERKLKIKEAIAERLDRLPEDSLYEVLDFVEFLGRKKAEYEAVESGEDPLVGLFAGSDDLSERSEEILHQEIRKRSGLTWKESLP